MKKPVTDFELLDKTLFYLNSLFPLLPNVRLSDHCRGAMASIFELFFYLKDKNLKYYEYNEK